MHGRLRNELGENQVHGSDEQRKDERNGNPSKVRYFNSGDRQLQQLFVLKLTKPYKITGITSHRATTPLSSAQIQGRCLLI